MKNEAKPKLNLSSILLKKQKQTVFKPFKWTIVLGLFVGLIYAYFQFALPWHWQLFLRWLVRGGDVNTVPTSLYQELNNLCQTANRSNHVNGYNGSLEIAYSLGKFECRLSSDQQYWLIYEVYGFDSTREAMKGTPIAFLLIKLAGQNYTYQINAIVPRR